MGIITSIPTNLDFPNRGVLERDDFVLAQETAQDLLAGAYTTALNQYATELNDTEADINLKWEQVQSQAVTGGYSQAYIDATFTPKILNTQTDKTTPIDADLIPLSDSDSSFGLKKLSWLNIKATLKTYFDTLYVALSGNQTIDGVKTFSSSPIIPTPTTGTQAVNKDYVDNGGTILQVVYAENKVVGTGSLTIPADGTIPQITEGNEILTCTITPKKANSRLLIEFTTSTQEVSNVGNILTVACFRNGVSNALFQTAANIGADGITENNITGRFIINTPTASPITFSLRAGMSAGQIRWNQINYSTLQMNTSTTATITEIA